MLTQFLLQYVVLMSSQTLLTDLGPYALPNFKLCIGRFFLTSAQVSHFHTYDLDDVLTMCACSNGPFAGVSILPDALGIH